MSRNRQESYRTWTLIIGISALECLNQRRKLRPYLDVILDKKDNVAIGENVSRFISLIEKSEFIVVVGTPLYRKKYENKVSETGSVVAAEVDLINLRLMSREEEKKTILPLLLEGDEENSFPPLIRGKVYGDFKSEEKYFENLFNLILTLYGISFDNPAIIDLLKSIQPSLAWRLIESYSE